MPTICPSLVLYGHRIMKPRSWSCAEQNAWAALQGEE
jgi:hypothetical protein